MLSHMHVTTDPVFEEKQTAMESQILGGTFLATFQSSCSGKHIEANIRTAMSAEAATGAASFREDIISFDIC